MQNIDLAVALGWDLAIYPMTLVHNVAQQVPTGVETRKPAAVFMMEASLPNVSGVPATIEGFSYTLNSDNYPQVTATFSSNISVPARVCVAYRD